VVLQYIYLYIDEDAEDPTCESRDRLARNAFRTVDSSHVSIFIYLYTYIYMSLFYRQLRSMIFMIIHTMQHVFFIRFDSNTSYVCWDDCPFSSLSSFSVSLLRSTVWLTLRLLHGHAIMTQLDTTVI
jgi:hypothetical protein